MGGKRLEVARLSLYVAIPIGLSAYFLYAPGAIDKLVKRYSFVVYPPADERAKELLSKGHEQKKG